MRPPGRSTRNASISAPSQPPHTPLIEVTESNDSSPHGRSNIVPTRRSAFGARSRAISIRSAAASMPAVSRPFRRRGGSRARTARDVEYRAAGLDADAREDRLDHVGRVVLEQAGPVAGTPAPCGPGLLPFVAGGSAEGWWVMVVVVAVSMFVMPIDHVDGRHRAEVLEVAWRSLSRTSPRRLQASIEPVRHGGTQHTTTPARRGPQGANDMTITETTPRTTPPTTA